jgi:hypothetical protein
MFKRTMLLIFSALVLFGCATTQNPLDVIYLPPNKSVCDIDPLYKDSVICKITKYLGETPEQLNDQLLDASLVGMWSKMVDKKDLKKSISFVRQYIVGDPQLTMQKLINYLTEKAGADPYLAMMLSRKINRLNIPEYHNLVFTIVDRKMIMFALDSQDVQLSAIIF